MRPDADTAPSVDACAPAEIDFWPSFDALALPLASPDADTATLVNPFAPPLASPDADAAPPVDPFAPPLTSPDADTDPPADPFAPPLASPDADADPPADPFAPPVAFPDADAEPPAEACAPTATGVPLPVDAFALPEADALTTTVAVATGTDTRGVLTEVGSGGTVGAFTVTVATVGTRPPAPGFVGFAA